MGEGRPVCERDLIKPKQMRQIKERVTRGLGLFTE